MQHKQSVGSFRLDVRVVAKMNDSIEQNPGYGLSIFFVMRYEKSNGELTERLIVPVSKTDGREIGT